MSDEKLEITNVQHGWEDEQEVVDIYGPEIEDTVEQPVESPEAPQPPSEEPKLDPEPPVEQPKDEVIPEPPTIEPEKVYDPFAELGFSEEKDKKYISQLHEAYKNGTLEEFLEKSTKDYNKLSDADVLRIKLQRENPGLEKEDMDFLISTELEKLGITGEDDELDVKGKKLLSIQLRKVREELQVEQQNYKATAYEHKPSPEQIKEQENYERLVKNIDENERFSELGRSKAISFDDFNVELPEIDLRAAAKNPSVILSKVLDSKGNVDADKLAHLAIAAMGLEKALKDAVSFGESKGRKAMHDELRGNNEPATPATTTKVPDKLTISNVRRGW